MPSDPPVVGLVLSGGGARSSFQIGALRYLYDEVRIAPSVITGASAGSIIAAVLAQGADHDAQRASLDRLERLWRQMPDSSAMFEELPWFARLRERGPLWMQAFERRKQRQGTLGRSFKRVADLRHGISTAAERVTGAGHATDKASGADGTSMGDAVAVSAPPTKLSPKGVKGDEADMSHGEDDPAWGPARLFESIEILRAVGRASTDLEAIVEGAQRERSLFRPGPIVDRLLDPDIFQAAAVADSGVALRIAVVALESGELRYVTERGRLTDRADRPVEEGLDVDLVAAVRASCAIPMVFAPVRLGEENYVDGGVRESLPAEIAMAHLGVDTCYAVVAGPSGLQQEDSYDHKDMFSILMRTTTAIMTDEVQRDEVTRARANGAVVVEPEFDVHDTLTVEPGLVAIAMDYGYLRAAEAHLGATAEEQAVTRDVVMLRRRIWRAEEDAFGGTASAGDEQLQRLAEITGLKFELRDLLRQMSTTHLPAGAEDWWRTWEHHIFEIPVCPSWARAAGN